MMIDAFSPLALVSLATQTVILSKICQWLLIRPCQAKDRWAIEPGVEKVTMRVFCDPDL